MIKHLICFIFMVLTVFAATQVSTCEAADYGRKLTREEKFGPPPGFNGGICGELKRLRKEKPQNTQIEQKSAGGGIIPDSVLMGIYDTTHKISDSVSLVMVLGQALTCNAVHANKEHLSILGITLFSYPNLPVWFSGAIIYFIGFMLTLSITFYLVDIAFKLGLAVIMLPIGVALWPFPPTKDRLAMLISMILKSAGIFVFLAMTVAFALNLIGEAGGGLEEIFNLIDQNATDEVVERFSLSSTNFLIVLFALIYGMKLIGSTIEDYADKFFPDKVLGGSSPIHGSLTQAMDFVKKKTVDPVKSWAGDVAKTQVGRLTAGAGKLMTGQYDNKIRKAGHYIANPGEAMDKSIQAAGRFTASVAGGTAKLANTALVGGVGRIVLGKNASKNLKDSLNQEIDSKVVGNITKAAQKAGANVGGSISSVTDKIKQSKAVHGITTAVDATSEVGNTAFSAIETGYDKALNSLDKLSNKIDNVKSKWRQGVDRLVPPKENDGLVKKVSKSVLRGTLKAPSGVASAIAKTPVKIVKTAVKATNVNSWLRGTGEVLQAVGDKMQRNKKTDAQRRAEAAQREAEEERRRKEEEEAKFKSGGF